MPSGYKGAAFDRLEERDRFEHAWAVLNRIERRFRSGWHRSRDGKPRPLTAKTISTHGSFLIVLDTVCQWYELKGS